MIGRLGLPAFALAVVMSSVVSAVVSPPIASASPTDDVDARRLFNQRCTACHTFGKGAKVGPDLKGVTERRPRAWLLQFIRSAGRMIDSGDPVAGALFQQFRPQRMPDWTDLGEAQIASLLDWLAAGGPDRREPDERSADLASAAEVELGRALFAGGARLAGGGMPCASCHSVPGLDGGGSFGPDLGGVYLHYQDRALTAFLRRPCFRRLPESSSAAFLTPEESFAIKAYLRAAALTGRSAPEPQRGTP